jgi:hypothetical protein
MMDTASIIDNQFTDAFNEANALCEQGHLDEGVIKARELLADPAIPRYHNMKVLLLLASAVDDWYDANGYRIDAEAIWQITRRWHPEGQDDILDTYMSDVRALLDECDKVLREEEPVTYDYDPDDAVEQALFGRNDEVADAQAMMEDLDIGAEEDDETNTTETDRPEGSSRASKVRHFAQSKLRASTDLPIAGCSVCGLGREA